MSLLWFIIGGAATFWFMKRSPMHAKYTCTFTDEDGQQHTVSGFGWGPDRGQFKRHSKFKSIDIHVERNCGVTTTTTTAAPGVGQRSANDEQARKREDWNRANQEKWQQHQDQVSELGYQVVDAMADMSESTLNSLETTVETLKAKLAEHRAQREAYLRQ